MLTDEFARKLNLELPADFKAYRDEDGGNLPPWHFLGDEEATSIRALVNSHFSRHRDCVPFAESFSTEDFVLFTPQGKVRPVHLFSPEGWESVMEYESFRVWLREAFADCIQQLDRMASGKWYDPDKKH